ncbi:MAG: FAD-dependent oxidoreductase [Helicobacteraceae bacterium]|nr:FAD-dependent oxidoreductase [Helicobacteraceae bacterium]
MFDIAIIGAGINGSALSYFLTKEGLSVALFDKSAIASGGSGAAGAFISPKISAKGTICELIEKAYLHSLKFYSKNFDTLTTNTSLLHISKDDKESKKIQDFKSSTSLLRVETPASLNKILLNSAKDSEAVYLKHSAVVKAKELCEALAKDAKFFNENITSLEYKNDHYVVGTQKAKKVILACGAYKMPISEPYIKLRGIWGHRIDVKTTSRIPCNIHHHLSLSPSSTDGTVAIGATHNVHYHPEQNEELYNLKEGRLELLKKASFTTELQNVNIVKDFVGLRCGTNDYMPYLGRVVNSVKTIEKFPLLVHGKKVAKENFEYHKDLFIINGSGGYGFVLAPYLAKQLSEYITKNTPLEEPLDPTRSFINYVKKEVKNAKN